MTREEFRDYVDFLRSQDEISYDVYSALIDGIDTLEQEPYDDAKYHEEHGEVIVDKAVWEDAKRALEQEPTREEALEHAKTLKEFCRDRDNLDDPCEDCPFHLYETGFGFCVLNYGLYPNEWFMPQERSE